MTSDTPRPDCVSLVNRAVAALVLLAPLDAPLLFLPRKGVPRQPWQGAQLVITPLSRSDKEPGERFCGRMCW